MQLVCCVVGTCHDAAAIVFVQLVVFIFLQDLPQAEAQTWSVLLRRSLLLAALRGGHETRG